MNSIQSHRDQKAAEAPPSASGKGCNLFALLTKHSATPKKVKLITFFPLSLST